MTGKLSAKANRSSYRVYVALDPEVYDAIGVIADLSRSSRSAIVREMIEGQKGMLVDLANTLARASSLSEEVKAPAREKLAEIERNLLDQAERVHAELAELLPDPAQDKPE